MVDLAFGRAVALIALALLAGCASSQAPLPASPQAGNVVRQDMANAIKAGDHVALTRNALLLARMGGGMSDHGFDGFASQLDPATLADAQDLELELTPNRIEALRNWYHFNEAQVDGGGARQVAEVPADYRIVEGIAYDAGSDRVFISTVVDGRLAYLEKGAWHEVPIGSPRGGLFGMAIDPKHRLLWIATCMVEESAPRDNTMAGLIAVNLDTLRVTDRIRSPDQGGAPGDVTVGHDGTVYLSDSKSGAILRYRPTAGAGAGLETLVPPGRFKSPQGMALSSDGKQLYVAEYGSGLWIVRLSDGQVTQTVSYGVVMLDGIDGLVKIPRENAVLAVQNGIVPRRVSRLNLTADGIGFEYLSPLHIVPREAGDPSLGTFRRGELWFVGDGQWERYGSGGTLKDGKPPRPTPILAVKDVWPPE